MISLVHTNRMAAGFITLCAWGMLSVELFAQPKMPTFENDIVPILKSRCYGCHGAKKRESGLDLRRKFTMVKGGESGPALDVKQPGQSLLLEMIEEGLMPPEGEPALSAKQIQTLKQWISAGAPLSGKTEAPLPAAETEFDPIVPAARKHWAFQPVGHVDPPRITSAAWTKSPIDAFILAELEKRSWQPAPPASRAEWLRRVTFDLTGLPPTPEEITAFENDSSPGAFEKVVDGLLASPHYGERWGQHWLDVVRFAETEGFEYDRHLPDAWRFRDYVIESFNRDKPYDQFVKEQIAGDEIAPEDPVCLSASIFHRLGAVRRNAGNPDIALSRNEVLTERTNIIGEAFLGLTVGCARCHNHKLEPILQSDYYRLEAYLAATAEHDVSLASEEEQHIWEEESKKIEKQMAKLKQRLTKSSGAAQDRLMRELAELEYQLPPRLPTIPGIRNDFENRTQVHVLRRGVWENKGIPVGPRPLSVLISPSVKEQPADLNRPRTHLANWLTGENHPLTARVMVNRIWQHHIGTGLVATANDFGTHGSPPSHPRLLDWLARRFMDDGWRMKPHSSTNCFEQHVSAVVRFTRCF